MTFGDFTSIFSDEKELLTETLSNPKWSFYNNLYLNIRSIIDTQGWKVMDTPVINQLLVEVCSRSNKFFYLSSSEKKLYSYNNKHVDEKIPILEVIERFPHEKIDECLERSQVDI